MEHSRTQHPELPDWVERAGDTIRVDGAAGSAEQIAALRRGRGYDLAVVDLPGAREGARSGPFRRATPALPW